MRWRGVLVFLLAAALAAQDAVPPPETGRQIAAVLLMRVLEGDGAVHGLNSRSWRPITVQVTDETGRPQAGVAVSFRLPDEGPGGTFASGLKSEVVVTAADGRASLWGILWNGTAGAFQIRVTCAKGEARAGLVLSQYLSEAIPASDKRSERAGYGPPRRNRLIYTMVAITAGLAAGGLAVGMSRKTSEPPAAAVVAPAQPLQIGTPTISIGRP